MTRFEHLPGKMIPGSPRTMRQNKSLERIPGSDPVEGGLVSSGAHALAFFSILLLVGMMVVAQLAPAHADVVTDQSRISVSVPQEPNLEPVGNPRRHIFN